MVSVAIMLPTFLLATPLVTRQAGALVKAVESADTTKKMVEKAPEIAQKGAPDKAINADSIAPIGGRLGLVLSGGGAKGLYHIGIIRALEENSIPIDYVSGTSMGAIIGALYASGYTPQQMEDIVLSGSVEQWVSGQIDDK